MSCFILFFCSTDILPSRPALWIPFKRAPIGLIGVALEELEESISLRLILGIGLIVPTKCKKATQEQCS